MSKETFDFELITEKRRQPSVEHYSNMSLEEKEARLERAKNTSSKKRNPNLEEANYKKDKHKIDAGKLGCGVVTSFLAGAIVITGIAMSINKISNNIIIDDVLENSMGIVASETFMNSDGNVIYSERGVAIKILGEEDLDLAIYGVYKTIDAEEEKKLSKMDRVMSEMSSVIGNNPEYYSAVPKYSSFTEYLDKKGFVDANGNVYTGLYEKQMDAYALALGKLNKVTERFPEDSTSKSLK